MKIKLIFITIFALSIVGGLQLYKPVRDVNPSLTICFGDSVTEGIDASRSYVDIISEEGYNVLHKGKAGHYMAKGLKRFNDDVIANYPGHVIIMFGLNDLRRELNESHDSLISMIETAKENNIIPILCTPTPHMERNKDLLTIVNMIKKVSKSHNVLLIDVHGNFPLDKTLMANEVHPNDKGHKIIATLLLEHFKNNFKIKK